MSDNIDIELLRQRFEADRKFGVFLLNPPAAILAFSIQYLGVRKTEFLIIYATGLLSLTISLFAGIFFKTIGSNLLLTVLSQYDEMEIQLQIDLGKEVVGIPVSTIA